MSTSPTIEALAGHIEEELVSIVSSNQLPLYRMMAYHMGWHDEQGTNMNSAPKQRTLGILCVLACLATGGKLEVVLPAASAVELVNNFFQIHDDVQAGIPQRDNRDTVWWIWGPAQAINTGDGMHALGRLALFRLIERGVSASKTFNAVQYLDEASLQTCEGKFLDLEAQEHLEMSLASYIKMVSSRTGALFSYAMRLGGLVATDDQQSIEAMGNCGANIGLAMQMHADIQNLWGSGNDSSVPSTEVMNKMKLFPIVYAMTQAATSDKRKLGEIYFKRVLEPKDVSNLRNIVDQMGIRDACENMVSEYRAKALASLDIPTISGQGKMDITNLIDSLFE